MKSVIEKFSVSPDLSVLDGGRGKVVKSGNLVIKPVLEPEKYEWYAGLFEKYHFSEIKYSRPVRSLSGSFIEDGYGATEFLNGKFFAGKMREKIQASHAFNSHLKDIPKPAEFDSWKSPWTNAQDLAWGKCQMPEDFNAKARSNLAALFRFWKKIDMPVQLIHTDLSGNILFDGNDPVIIDFTPGYFPKEYADVLLVSDSIAWFDEPVESLDLLALGDKVTFQLLLRAVLFRLSVSLFFDPRNYEGFNKEYLSFVSLINVISKW